MKKKIVIIGANDFQNQLILKAKENGYETHVFAWKCGDVGEITADYFYPVSIVEKDLILEQCRRISPVGVCSIASDLAAITVNYVARALGLTANSARCSEISTNKSLMREAFDANKDPSPKSICVTSEKQLENITLRYPIIVKPVDRSGSRGITKLTDSAGLEQAVRDSIAYSFTKKAVVEEYVGGQEYSVEFISYKGVHTFLAMTQKFTTGAPHFIETAHLQPAPVSDNILKRVQKVVSHALDSLEIKNGASHSELKIDRDGTINLIEIGGRMGGDCIGSDLVYLSTGYDFMKMVIDVACGKKPEIVRKKEPAYAAVKFLFKQADVDRLQHFLQKYPDLIYRVSAIKKPDHEVVDSSSRLGYYLIASQNKEQLVKALKEVENWNEREN